MAKSSNKSTTKGKKATAKKATKPTVEKTTPVDQEVKPEKQVNTTTAEETPVDTTVPVTDESVASEAPEGSQEKETTEVDQSPSEDEKSSETASQDVTGVELTPSETEPAEQQTPEVTATAGSHVETTGGPSDVNSKRLSADQAIVESFARQLDDYIEHMGTAKPLTPQQGGQWQRKLYNALQNALGVKGSLFNRVWGTILEKVSGNRQTTFNERYIYRFMDETKMSGADVRNFSNIIHLMISTADPKGRQQALKMIDLASVTRGIYIEGVTDRLQEFYSL